MRRLALIGLLGLLLAGCGGRDDTCRAHGGVLTIKGGTDIDGNQVPSVVCRDGRIIRP